MIEEAAVVVKTEGHTVWLESSGSKGCGQCQHKGGCGQVFSQLFGIKKPQYKAKSSQLLKPGDQVLLGLDERALVRGSLLIYILPLFVMFLLAVLAAGISSLMLISHEGLVITTGIFGFYLGFRIARSKASTISTLKAFQPVILKQLD